MEAPHSRQQQDPTHGHTGTRGQTSGPDAGWGWTQLDCAGSWAPPPVRTGGYRSSGMALPHLIWPGPWPVWARSLLCDGMQHTARCAQSTELTQPGGRGGSRYRGPARGSPGRTQLAGNSRPRNMRRFPICHRDFCHSWVLLPSLSPISTPLQTC